MDFCREPTRSEKRAAKFGNSTNNGKKKKQCVSSKKSKRFLRRQKHIRLMEKEAEEREYLETIDNKNEKVSESCRNDIEAEAESSASDFEQVETSEIEQVETTENLPELNFEAPQRSNQKIKVCIAAESLWGEQSWDTTEQWDLGEDIEATKLKVPEMSEESQTLVQCLKDNSPAARLKRKKERAARRQARKERKEKRQKQGNSTINIPAETNIANVDVDEYAKDLTKDEIEKFENALSGPDNRDFHEDFESDNVMNLSLDSEEAQLEFGDADEALVFEPPASNVSQETLQMLKQLANAVQTGIPTKPTKHGNKRKIKRDKKKVGSNRKKKNFRLSASQMDIPQFD